MESHNMSSIPCGRPSVSPVTILITKVNLDPLSVLVELWCNFDQEKKAAYEHLAEDIQCPRKRFHDLEEGSPGDFCLVRVDETWYRARIVSRNGTNYSVYLVDKGLTRSADTSMLAWGQEDFFHLPPQVKYCVLSNIQPLSSESRWTPNALEFLRLLSGKSVTAYVQDVLVHHRIFLLDIPCISRQMYEMGFAKRLSPKEFKDFVLVSLQSHSSSAVMSTEMGNEPRKMSALKQEQFMYPELQTGTVETVIVTEVTNPLRIFCQLKVFSQELKKQTELIMQHYEDKLGTNAVRLDMLGSPCATRGSDGQWYRSILQQIIPARNVVEVLHVDYGQKQVVPMENIRPLAPEFFRMPVVAYVCSLHGIIDKGLGWTASQVDHLRSLLLYRTVIAKFEYQSVSEGVHYVTLYGEDKTSINHLFGCKEKCLLEVEKLFRDYAIHINPFKPQHPALLENQGNIPAPLKAMKETEEKAVTKVSVKLPVEDLPLNSSHVAVVQHVSNPSEFWIQTQNYANEFNELTDCIADLYGDPACEDVLGNPTVGLYCAAKAQDDAFYRATVTEVAKTQIKVYFVDYGDTDMIARSSIRVLPDKFKELPQLALKCKLADVKPNDETWSHNATEHFTKTVADKFLDVHVKAKMDDYYVVQVIDSEACGEKDVGMLMCNSGFAEKDEAQKKPTAKVTIRPAIMPTTLNDVGNCLTTDPTWTENIPRFKEHMFPTGSTFDVEVSFIESLNDFWCSLVQSRGYLNFLMKDMQTYYMDSQFQHPVEEEACVARHPDNGMWYRAFVIQKHVTPHVDVLLVDYGQKKTVSLHDLRRISPTFLKLESQAFRCSLYNPVNPTSVMNDWGKDAMAQFQEFVDTAESNHETLKCTIYVVMYNDNGIVFNIVGLETPFESISNQMVHCAPLSKSPTPFFYLDTYCYATHNIKMGAEEKVTVTSVENVNHFYCQLERNADVLDNLVVNVESLCHQLKNLNHQKAIGTVCFAKYTDGHWYRGQIKATEPSVLIHFVDYGNTIEVDMSDLLRIPKEASDIMSVPVQAVQCSLSDIDIPFNVPSEVNSWFETTASGHSFSALVVAKEANGKLLVELYEGKTQVNAKIKEKFCIEATSKEQVVCQVLKDKAKTSKVNPMGDETKSCEANWRSAPKPLRQIDENCQKTMAPLPRKCLAPLSEPYRAPHQRQLSGRTPSCLRNESSPTEVYTKPMNQNTLTELKKPIVPNLPATQAKKKVYVAPEPNVKALPKLTDLPSKSVTSGMEADVFVSHCNSLLSFYVQLVKEEDDIISIVDKLNDEQTATEIIGIEDLHPGDLVNAEFPDDSSWYRAVVREIHGGTALVEFIDFGNTAIVSISKMCRLLRPFLQTPRFSTHCLLSGAAAHGNEEELDPEIVSTFKEDIGSNGDKKLKCRFVRQSGPLWEVRLEDGGRKVMCKIPSRGPMTISDVTPESSGEVKAKPGSSTTTTREIPTEKSKLNSGPLHYLTIDFTVGQSLEAYVANITGPQSFWCQSANSEELDLITERVSEVVSAVQCKPVGTNSLSPGSSCVALFKEDEQWYRAEVLSKDGDVLSILFVDYGNESQVNLEDVREIPLDLVESPSQAFLCQLEGFNASHSSWDDGALDRLSELIMDKLLQLTVVKVSTEKESGTRQTCFVQVECKGQVINETMRAHWKSASMEKKPDGTGVLASCEMPLLACDQSAINETAEPESHLSDGYLRTSQNLIMPQGDGGILFTVAQKDQQDEHVIIQAADETSEPASTLNNSDCSDDCSRSEVIADAQKEMSDQIPLECNATNTTHAVTQSQSLKEMDEIKSIPTIVISAAEPSDTGAIELILRYVHEDQTTPSPPAKYCEQETLISSTVNAVEMDKGGEKEIVSLMEKALVPDDFDASLYTENNIVGATASYIDQAQMMGTKGECSHAGEAKSETLIAGLEAVPEELETKDEEENSGPVSVGSICITWSDVINSWCKAKVLKKMKDCTRVLLIDQDTEVIVHPDDLFFETVSSDQCDTEDNADPDTSSSHRESQEDSDEHSDDSEDTIIGDDSLNTVAAEEMFPDDCVPETKFDLHKTFDMIPVKSNQVQEEPPLSFCAPLEQSVYQSTESGVVEPVPLVPAEQKDNVIEEETSHEEEHSDVVAESEAEGDEQHDHSVGDQTHHHCIVRKLHYGVGPDAQSEAESESEGGDHSEAEGGEQREAEGGDHSEAEGGDHSEAEGGDHSEAEGGDHSEAEGGDHSEAEGGDHSEAEGGEQRDHAVPTLNTCLPQQVCSLEDQLVQAATEEASPVQEGLESRSPTEHAVLKDDEFEAETQFSDESLEKQTSMLTTGSLIDDNFDDSVIFVCEFKPQQQKE